MAEGKNLTIKEISKALSIGENSIRRWIKEGAIQANKRGRNLIVSLSDMASFVNENNKYMESFKQYLDSSNIKYTSSDGGIDIESNDNDSGTNNEDSNDITTKLMEEQLKLIDLKRKRIAIEEQISTAQVNIEYYNMLLEMKS